MTRPAILNESATAEHALKYLARADQVPHRAEGEAVVLELVPRYAEIYGALEPGEYFCNLEHVPSGTRKQSARRRR